MISVLSSMLTLVSLLPCTFSIAVPLSPLSPLSHSFTNQNPLQDPLQKLNHLVSTSLARAHHLKNSNTTPTASAAATTKTPIFSNSYGAYSIPLSFGTPPQTLSFIMDTGSDIVWLPCTSHYTCKNCSSSRIPSFIPKQSSTSKILGCKNPKCSWFHHTNLDCQDCSNTSTSSSCNQICPPYLILYGSGATGGIALSETLHLYKLTTPNFLVGCSVFSSHIPTGIAGFGRSNSSLPSQLGLSKFSYCLLPHKFDDSPISSSLVLDSETDSDKKTTSLMYTPFLMNPKVEESFRFSVYYYLGLRRVTVGGQKVKIPYKYLAPGNDGNGGTIIDSGTTLTFMASDAFEALSEEIIVQMKKYKRAVEMEVLTGLRPCFNVSGVKVKFPQLKFHFKGGADMALPVENYFAVVDGGAVCLTVVSDGAVGQEAESGPGIILGNFQMQNFHLEYDLKNGRLGFKQQKCL